MHIVQYFHGSKKLPVTDYGGTERVSYWLGKAFAELGHRVTYLCHEEGNLPFANLVKVPYGTQDLRPYIPDSADIIQLYNHYPITDGFSELNYEDKRIMEPIVQVNCPVLVGAHGNARPGEVFHPNTIFVSANHAHRHHWTEFIHNGIDLSEYPFKPTQKQSNEPFLVFLAAAHWKAKNLAGAIQIAHKAGIPLQVAGGHAPFWSHRVTAHGMVGGLQKLKLLQAAHGMIFPVIWEEPFGVAVIEALACGTPVLATPRGALPEIIDQSCGLLGNSLEELVEGVRQLSKIEPEACRQRVIEKFSHITMAEKYIQYYQRIIQSGRLREGNPYADTHIQKYFYYDQPKWQFWLNQVQHKIIERTCLT
jgi:glycosyltransferase involved in cell wall biosynthesis